LAQRPNFVLLLGAAFATPVKQGGRHPATIEAMRAIGSIVYEPLRGSDQAVRSELKSQSRIAASRKTVLVESTVATQEKKIAWCSMGTPHAPR
jgi:hypothetical protein